MPGVRSKFNTESCPPNSFSYAPDAGGRAGHGGLHRHRLGVAHQVGGSRVALRVTDGQVRLPIRSKRQLGQPQSYSLGRERGNIQQAGGPQRPVRTLGVARLAWVEREVISGEF